MGGAIERRFLVVTGEASGDRHAARLIEALRALGPCQVRGVTGPALEAAGVETVASISDLAVIGFSAVLPRLPRIWGVYRRLLAELERFRPHACVLVDSPGFNLRLGPALKRRGAKVFYYIAPQVWAWHPERAAAMSRWVDRLAVVFPFEEQIFRSAGVRATFVGHPLLDGLAPEVDEATLRAELEIDAARPIVGLLPGSRGDEIRHHAPTLVSAAERLARTRPEVAFVVALADHCATQPGLADGPWRELGLPRGVPNPDDAGFSRRNWTLRIATGRTRAVQKYATACAVASGTATLETALFGTPLAIVYRVGALNFAIAKRVVRLPRIGLPNIVAGSEVAPELIQGGFTAERVAAALAPWLDDPAANAAQRAQLGIVREKLGAPGASRRAAELLWELAA